MRLIDIHPGVMVNVYMEQDNLFAEGVVSVITNNNYQIDIDTHQCILRNLPEQVTVLPEKFNLTWSVKYEDSFPKVGKVTKGSNIVLGKGKGKVFSPGSVTLFADGFMKVGNEIRVIGRNLNQNLYKELPVSSYGKDWIIMR